MMTNKITAIAEQLNINGVISFVPTGNSMWPTLKNKGQAVVVQKKTDRLKKFDVALYVLDDKLVLHRVIKVESDGYITCGDSQFNLERVPENCVLGVMTGFYQKEKFIDVNSPDYKARVKKWYINPKKRRAKVNRFYFFEKVKSKLKRIFGKKGD